MEGKLEKEEIIKKAQKFNGSIETIKDMFEHMDRLQRCSICGEDYFDKWCSECVKEIVGKDYKEQLEKKDKEIKSLKIRLDRRGKWMEKAITELEILQNRDLK